MLTAALSAVVCVVVGAIVVVWASVELDRRRRRRTMSARDSVSDREGADRDELLEHEADFDDDVDAQETFSRELARSGFFGAGGGEDDLFFDEEEQEHGAHQGDRARREASSAREATADSPSASTTAETTSSSARRTGGARRRFGNSRGGGGSSFSSRPNAMRMLEALEALSQEAESLERSGAGGGLGIPQSLRGLLEQLNDAGAGGETAVRASDHFCDDMYS